MTQFPPGGSDRDPRRISTARITTWIIVGGIGVFLLVSGIMGIIAKG